MYCMCVCVLLSAHHMSLNAQLMTQRKVQTGNFIHQTLCFEAVQLVNSKTDKLYARDLQ